MTDIEWTHLPGYKGETWNPAVHHGASPVDAADRLHLIRRKGGDPAEWPEDLRVRQWPEGAL